jgi:UDP-glucose:(heptosyl)LPS alpha-1,3-glucosyltransferase
MYECARFLAARHDVTVFANEWDAEPPAGSFRYHAVPARRRPDFLYGLAFFKSCSALLHPDEFDAVGTFGCVAPLGGVYWAQSVHPSWLDRSKSFRKPLSPARIKQRLNPLHPVLLQLEEKHFRGRTDSGGKNYRKIVATTPEVKSDLNSYYGVPAEDVVVIPNGFSPDEFSDDMRRARRGSSRSELGIEDGEIVLLFIANELERKGYATILRAMQILKEFPLRLLAAGRFNAQEATELAASAGLSDKVKIIGPTSDVAGLHAAADIFVLPTQYEAFSLAILEALGSGLPVATTQIPGARDAIIHGTNGVIIDDPRSGEQYAEALRPLMEKNERERITSLVPATAEQYQWPRVLERYEDVLLHSG